MADAQVSAWLHQASGAPVWLERPREHGEELGIGLYLLELAEQPPARDGKPAPLQIQLGYLVTAWGSTQAEEHRVLGDLVFAALARADWEVALRPPEPATWAALGVPPRPCFMLRVPLRLERPAAVAPRVRQPMVVRSETAVPLVGRVVGPGDQPIAGARVELASPPGAAQTGRDGGFVFAQVPAEPRAKRLRVIARGEAREFTAEVPAGGGPVIIRFEPLEA